MGLLKIKYLICDGIIETYSIKFKSIIIIKP